MIYAKEMGKSLEKIDALVKFISGEPDELLRKHMWMQMLVCAPERIVHSYSDYLKRKAAS
jgi:hypothetical protein